MRTTERRVCPGRQAQSSTHQHRLLRRGSHPPRHAVARSPTTSVRSRRGRRAACYGRRTAITPRRYVPANPSPCSVRLCRHQRDPGSEAGRRQPIIAIDNMQASSHGAAVSAHTFIDASVGNAAAQVAELNGGRGADAAFEVVACRHGPQVFRHDARRGAVRWWAWPVDRRGHAPHMVLTLGEKNVLRLLLGSCDPNANIPLSSTCGGGRLRSRGLIAQTSKLDDVNGPSRTWKPERLSGPS